MGKELYLYIHSRGDILAGGQVSVYELRCQYLEDVVEEVVGGFLLIVSVSQWNRKLGH